MSTHSPHLAGIAPERREAVRALFSKFRRVLDLNTRTLGVMAEMERALGGEYIFDQAFLEKTVHQVTSLARQVVYSLNALGEYRYMPLFDRFESIRATLLDILAGRPGPHSDALVLSLDRVHWENMPMVGRRGVCLAELRRQDMLASSRPLDGFVLTGAGCRLLAGTGETEALPGNLETALEQEVEDLFDRLGREVPLRLVASSFDPEDYSELPAALPHSWLQDVDPASLGSALRRVLGEAEVEQAGEESVDETGTAVFVLAQPPKAKDSPLSCRVTTFVRDGRREAMELLASPDDSSAPPDAGERWLLSRIPPYLPLESVLIPAAGKAGRQAKDSGALRRGSALLSRQKTDELAALAMALEHALGSPVRLETREDETGRLAPLDAAPLGDGGRRDPEEQDLHSLEEELCSARVLLSGGETAQLGVAAGRVVHVLPDTDPWNFPLGAVAVAHEAGPRLSPVLQRAAALVTEKGGAASHLATIAREYRVPCLMGVPNALETLPEGTEVTLDAGEAVVFDGVLEALLRSHDAGDEELYPTDPEYIRLRQLLRLITPLHLVDPESPDFSIEGCRSIHDMIHFCHERAVEELLYLHERRDGLDLRRLETRKLLLDAPLDLRVMDVETAVAPDAGSELRPADIRCAPLQAFLRGLEFEEMWSSEPMALRLRHIFSAMDKSAALLTGGSPFAGQSLAIVGLEYMNLSLRLGYHFSVVDALLSRDPNNNYVYFRFAGGLAEASARRRRAELIQSVLEGLNFRVALQQDLVVGRLKMGEQAAMERALVLLGELTGFTRQLDVNMASDADVEAFASVFLERTRTRTGIAGGDA